MQYHVSAGVGEWPKANLEFLGKCPVCGDASRRCLHQHLTDDAFGCAEGRWDLHLCKTCGNSYLDPRPDISSIGRAYKSYYTHKNFVGRERFESLSLFRKIQRLGSNFYTNTRYGTQLLPINWLAGLLLAAMPWLRIRLDYKYRFLPKPDAGDKLLDVGCGNGSFLADASSCGWQTFGVDPDPAVIAHAREHATEVRVGGIEQFRGHEEQFAAITLNHSLEHVHDPVGVITEAARLLKNGGVLYLETPNIDALGHWLFGRHWRGLEAPRHLVIFSVKGLSDLLSRSGFVEIEVIRRPEVLGDLVGASMRMQRGTYRTSGKHTVTEKASVAIARWAAYLLPTARLEFITVTAKRKFR
jgi:2-polyprenyl-3-methyl-5-hydroxy-6-metoxy-1,4-benzoquinol methylase